MIQFLLFLFSLVLIAVPVMAQFYDGKSDELRTEIDKKYNEESVYYSNIPNPGIDEDAKLQNIRYQELTNAVNEANERHFIMGKGGME